MNGSTQQNQPSTPQHMHGLPRELRNIIYSHIPRTGQLSEYSGLLLASRAIHEEASAEILHLVNTLLSAVKGNWDATTSTRLRIPPITSLREAKNITMGLPKSWFYSPDTSTPPDDVPRAIIGSGPLSPVLDLHCSVLTLRIYKDAAWTGPMALQDWCINEGIRNLYGELETLVRERRSTAVVGLTPDASLGRVEADTIVFEWGVLGGVWDTYGTQYSDEMAIVADVLAKGHHGGSWWRHRVRRADGVHVDLAAGPVWKFPIDDMVPGRMPTVAIVLDKIEARRDPFSMEGAVYAKDLRGTTRDRGPAPADVDFMLSGM